MGFCADIVQDGKKYMVLIDAEELWACVAHTVTQGWDVPDDVLLRSFNEWGHACMPGTCQDGLFSHWVDCLSDYDFQAMEGLLPKDVCQRRDDCPLYRGAGGPCDGWAVALENPTVSDVASWLTWDALVQLHQKLGIAMSSEEYAQLKPLRCEHEMVEYWHMDDPIALAAEVVRRQMLCEDLIAFGPPEVSDTHITLSLRPTEAFFDKMHEMQAAKKAVTGPAGANAQNSEEFSPTLLVLGLACLSFVIAIFLFQASH